MLIERVIVFLILSTVVFTQADLRKENPKIMILGTYHMANPGTDDTNSEADDVTTSKRQKEIEDVLNSLAEFNPTKIGVEVPVKLEDSLMIWYQDFLTAENSPGDPNEIYQIGFKLAKKLNHNRLYPIDYKIPMPISKTFEYAEEAGQAHLVDLARKSTKEVAGKFQEIQSTGTVLDLLRFLNSDRVDVTNEFYLASAQIGKDTNYIGADMVSGWYERNLKIFINITRLAESNTDRIIVIIGTGHLTLLKRFIKDAPNFEFVPANDFLTAE